MSIELATALTTKTAETSTSASLTGSISNDASTSFKEQFESVKSQENKSTNTGETESAKTPSATKSVPTAEKSNANSTIVNQQGQAEEASAQQAQTEKQVSDNQAQATKTVIAAGDTTTNQTQTGKTAGAQQAQTGTATKSKLDSEKDLTDETTDNLDPLDALSAKISTLSALKGKNASSSKTNIAEAKIENKTSDKNDYCQILKLDKNDSTFFLNLVTNQETAAQSLQAANQATGNNFVQIKSEVTQQTVQVSQGLIDALNDSAKTGKSVRIDFDNNIAVVMKLDKNGAISANFIPGDAAVENYLRNNLAGLRQNFDNQNLAYNQLTYTKQQKQEQQKQQNQNKENQNE